MIHRAVVPVVVLVAFLTTVSGFTADHSVALRVDVRTVEDRGDRVQVEVVAQAAPEDRDLLGATPWLSLELRHGEETVVQWAGQTTLDSEGSARLEMTVRPGTYQLEVSLTALKYGNRGVWIGPATVGSAPPTPPPSATPTPTPPPDVVKPDPKPEPVPPPSSVTPELQAESTASVDTTVPPAELGAATTASASSGAPPATATTTVPAADALTGAAEPVPTIPPTPAATVTPLPTATPTPRPTPSPTPEPPPPPTRTWADLPNGTRDITVQLVTRQQQLGDRTNLVSLDVGGAAVPVVAIGAADAPLSLVLVIQAPAERREALAETLAPRIIDLLRTGGGAASVADDSASLWLDQIATIRAAIASQEEPAPFTDRLATAFALLEERPGRRILLVHTEGGPAVDRSAWKDFSIGAERSGAQILVSALWTETLVERDRRQLRKLAVSSGGRMELVEAPALLDKVYQALARRLAATAAIRIQDGHEGKVKIESVPPVAVEAHPERIR